MITILDKRFSISIKEATIQQQVAKIAARIDEDYGEEPPILLGILNGSFMFLSDLAKHIKVPVLIAFMKVSSYQGLKSTGAVEKTMDVGIEIAGRHVIIVEDIVDTGASVAYIKSVLLEKNPKSLAVAALLQKPGALIEEEVSVDYLGFSIENRFVVGYGLDYEEYGRNLPDIYELIE